MNLQDLTFIDEGNPDFLDADKQIINFDKRMRLSTVINNIIKLQSEPYKFRPVSELLDELSEVTGFGPRHDEISYRLSKYIENVTGVLSHDDISEIEIEGVVLHAPKHILTSRKSVMNFKGMSD